MRTTQTGSRGIRPARPTQVFLGCGTGREQVTGLMPCAILPRGHVVRDQLDQMDDPNIVKADDVADPESPPRLGLDQQGLACAIYALALFGQLFAARSIADRCTWRHAMINRSPQRPPTSRPPPSSERRSSRTNWRRSRRSRCQRRARPWACREPNDSPWLGCCRVRWRSGRGATARRARPVPTASATKRRSAAAIGNERPIG